MSEGDGTLQPCVAKVPAPTLSSTGGLVVFLIRKTVPETIEICTARSRR
jgi:hypothetical protein